MASLHRFVIQKKEKNFKYKATYISGCGIRRTTALTWEINCRKKSILHKIKSWPHFISYTGNKDQLPEKCAWGVHLAMDIITESYTLYPE